MATAVCFLAQKILVGAVANPLLDLCLLDFYVHSLLVTCRSSSNFVSVAMVSSAAPQCGEIRSVHIAVHASIRADSFAGFVDGDFVLCWP